MFLSNLISLIFNGLVYVSSLHSSDVLLRNPGVYNYFFKIVLPITVMNYGSKEYSYKLLKLDLNKFTNYLSL